MKALFFIFVLSFNVSSVFGQISGKLDGTELIKEELKRLFVAYNEAGAKRDRQALEQMFADDYLWIQANGNIYDKAKHINAIVTNTAEFSVPMLTFNDLHVFGDVAINRNLTNELSATTIFAKRNNRWQFVQAVSVRVPPARKMYEIAAQTLDACVGNYEFSPGAVGVVTKEANGLVWQGGRRPKARLLALSENRFYIEDTDIEIVFVKDGERVTGLDFRQGVCQESKAKRIK